MILAAIEGNIIALIVFAAIGVINWLLQKKEEQANQAPPPGRRPPRPRPDSDVAPPSQPAPDDERLRRFMEALGLPADQAPPATPRPPPLPHPIREMPPVPRASGQTIPRRPRRVPPEPPPLPRRGRSLDDEPEPSLPVQQISLDRKSLV